VAADASARFVLTQRRTGIADGALEPVVVLHDRYADLDALDDLADRLTAERLVVAVRAARAQILDQFVHGYYWYLEIEAGEPELSTLGDALAQLETLLLDVTEGAPGGRAVLVGEGQGGVVALLLASIWPEKVRAVVALDAAVPVLPDEVGLEATRMDGLPVLLIGEGSPGSRSSSDTFFEGRGASVQRVDGIRDRGARLARAAVWIGALAPHP
jgi:pimeloyl-ACP methyl ester carboxylesterase